MVTAHPRRAPILPPIATGSAAVVGAALMGSLFGPEPVTRLLLIAIVVGVLSAVIADRRAWLTVTAVGAVCFLVPGVDRPYVAFLALAALLGRAQRWMAEPGQSRPATRR